MPEPLHVLRWQRPPAPARPGTHGARGSIYDEAAAELRENPGLWGVIYEGAADRAAGMASQVNNGVHACFRPAGSFEAVARRAAGVRTVYARYIGDEEAGRA